MIAGGQARRPRAAHAEPGRRDQRDPDEQPAQSAIDAIADTRAAAGAAAPRSQVATEGNVKRWKTQALSPARTMRESLTQNAGLAIHSVA